MTRIAIVSDIHSNAEALEAVLCDIDSNKVDAIWCLGDVVGYGHDPVWCLQAIEERADVVLAGNHDLAVAGVLDPYLFNGWARAGVEYSRQQLAAHAPALLERLGTRASQMRLRAASCEASDGLSGLPSILLAHGCPEPFDPVNDYIELDVTPERLARELHGVNLVAVGHTHNPFVWMQHGPHGHSFVRRDVDFTTDPAFTVDLADADIAVLNVGSVGQPRDGDWRACWTLLELSEHGDPQYLQWMRVGYDIDRAIERIASAGLPNMLGARLLEGR